MRAYTNLLSACVCAIGACASNAAPAPADMKPPQLAAAVAEQPAAAGSGTHVAATSSATTSVAANSSNVCPERFTVATRSSITMSWPDTIGYLGGPGMLTTWSRTTLTRTANGTKTEVISCGVALPVVTTSPLLDGIQLANEIPLASFDLPSMPRFVGSSQQQGADTLIEAGAMLLGASLSDPRSAWPQRAQLQLVDHDADGKPGVTAIPRADAPYGLPPADVGQVDHVDAVYIASRIALQLTTSDSLCAGRAEGSVAPQGFDYTIVGCHVLGAGDCQASQVNLLANNQPTFTLGAQGRWASVPIAESASCAAVLAALPPE